MFKLWVETWAYLKSHDLPNWATFAFTSLIWPVAILLWNRRSYTSIRNLQIIANRERGKVGIEECPYLVLNFENNTGEMLYIANAVIRVTRLIKALPNADQDLSTRNYTLKFAEKAGEAFSRLQTPIDTGKRVSTGLPLSREYTEEQVDQLIEKMRTHKSNRIRAKYFILEFDATVGRDHRRVKFKF